MYAHDLFYATFRSIEDGPGLKALFLGSGCLALAGLAGLASWRKARPYSWVLLVSASALICLGLLTVSEAQFEERLSPLIKGRYFVHGDGPRTLAQLGLVALPLLIAGIKLGRDHLALQRRRSLLSTYLRIAAKAYLGGDFDRAIAEYSIALKTEPARPDLHVLRGRAWAQKGDYDRALADFARALKLDGDLPSAHLHRGVVLAARGDHPDAVDAFESALAITPTDAAPLLHRGLSLARMGATDRAALDFRRLLRQTNHSDFTEPARFHLAMLEAEGLVAEAGTI